MCIFRSAACIFLGFILNQANSQNLVPNPSFENYHSLPCDYVYSATEFDSYLYDWTMPTSGTSDVYNTSTASDCISNCFSTAPSRRGHQLPRTGNTMCGIYTYVGSINPNYREYLQVRLAEPLVAGKSYYAEMYVSAADNNRYGTNNLGMYFSAARISDPNSIVHLPVTPQLKETTVVLDYTNWVKISGVFVATEAAQYLTIGNFDEDINTVLGDISNNSWLASYYFIEDVLVKENTCLTYDSSSTICAGNSITLSLPIDTVARWTVAGDPNTTISTSQRPVVAPSESIVYLAWDTCGSVSSFSVVVDEPIAFELPTDTAICSGQQLILTNTVEDVLGTWQDGSHNATYPASTTGTYSLTLTNTCGSFSDQMFLKVDKKLSFSFPMDHTICIGEKMLFDASNDNAQYLWQDSSTQATYTASDTGTYSVVISNACGSIEKSTTLSRCCEGALIPNLITPNEDGLNDIFDIGCLGSGGYELKVVNEWGAAVYYNKSYLNNWTASNISDGIYYYEISQHSLAIAKGWLQILK